MLVEHVGDTAFVPLVHPSMPKRRYRFRDTIGKEAIRNGTIEKQAIEKEASIVRAAYAANGV